MVGLTISLLQPSVKNGYMQRLSAFIKHSNSFTHLIMAIEWPHTHWVSRTSCIFPSVYTSLSLATRVLKTADRFRKMYGPENLSYFEKDLPLSDSHIIALQR